MTKPDDIPQWTWDEAGRVFSELLSIPSEVYQEESWSLDQEHIARALLEAERRGTERAAVYIEQRPGLIPDRQEIAAAIRAGSKGDQAVNMREEDRRILGPYYS